MTILEHEIMMTEQLRRVPADELQARLNNHVMLSRKSRLGSRAVSSGREENRVVFMRACDRPAGP